MFAQFYLALLRIICSLRFGIAASAIFGITQLTACNPVQTSAIHGRSVSPEPSATPFNQDLRRAPSTSVRATVNKQGDEQYVVDYEGIHFVFSPMLGNGVDAKEEKEIPLEYETDKPDSATPQHRSFQFQGSYATKHQSSFFNPEIHIYGIEDYRRVLSVSPRYVSQFDATVEQLRRLLARKPSRVEGKLPFLPFGLDAKQEFHAHLKYVTFESGEGVFFLTEYNIEPTIVNNQKLTYVFQGLTGDGHYYVSVLFPVSTALLPDDPNPKEFEDYRLPPYFYDPADIETNVKRYHQYIKNLKGRLDKLPSGSYEPDLTKLEETISSLIVKK